jgi:Winged helix DNA-binding domain
VLDRRTLNRSLLARQFLLERVDVPILDAVERLMGMQAQVPLDPYVALWSRLRAFDPTELGRLLLDRKLVRMTLMRATLHLVSARDGHRVRSVLQGVIERAFASSPFCRNLADLDLAPLLARGVELVEQEPRTIAQMAVALGEEWPRHDPTSLAYAVRYLVPLVQVTPRGVWGKTLQPTVTTLTCWVGGPSGATMSGDELVLRYLSAFGPATVSDIRAWSGLAEVRALIGGLRPRLRVYRDEAGRELYDVRDGVFGDRSAPAPVRFLPQYDNLLLAHADRTRIMDQVTWGTAFTHHGTVFVDGFLTGAWRLNAKSHEAALTVELRAPVGRADLKQVASEAEQLLEFLTPQARSRRLSVLPS